MFHKFIMWFIFNLLMNIKQLQIAVGIYMVHILYTKQFTNIM
jgi:hypothetical protein